MEKKDDYIVNINDLESDGVINCPYCCKGKAYIYGAINLFSLNKINNCFIWRCDDARDCIFFVSAVREAYILVIRLQETRMLWYYQM